MSIIVEEIVCQLSKDLPNVEVMYLENPSPSEQHSILVESDDLVEVMTYLRDSSGLEFDYLSNLSGVDWPNADVAQKVAIEKSEAESEEGTESQSTDGFLEVVYHLYSMARKEGPLVLRARTQDRGENNSIASVTPVYRSAEFQEREAFDLFGIDFTGHPDLRRILMWDEYEDFPMRKDYVNPDDYEYEPTPHADTLKRAEVHYPQEEPEPVESKDKR
ncbi:MAG: NADH-quinone oxidoreductase subunit C [Verrucomicrobiae bacterium]|nr:NADH-quinone oxidoreductase subunit C [Verrucomicrobiae bacterium]NNJ43069.1 NADH-quinone oxidoreductase subunit C [Akkermansiaceae bacterium]